MENSAITADKQTDPSIKKNPSSDNLNAASESGNQPSNNPLQETENAAQLMAEGTANIVRPKQMRMGEKIKGKLVSIGEKHAFVDIGEKSEALMAKDALLDKEGNYPAIGSEISANIISMEDGTIELGKQLSSNNQSKQAFEDALTSKIPVEGKVVARNKGGLEVKVFGKRAFCPSSHIELRFCDNPDAYIGQTLQFRVIEIRENGKQIVVSRKDILEEESKKDAVSIREKLHEGAEFDGRVTSLTDYGAFVDIGGNIEGLVHVSEISHQRVNHPKEALQKGQSVRVKVLKYEPEQNRISLSMKSLEVDPWNNNHTQFAEQSIVKGKVVRLEKFGAFVELAPGVDGLIHISELSHKRVQNAEEIVTIGQEVEVKIIRNEPDKRRIGLSMKELEESEGIDSIDERKPSYEEKRPMRQTAPRAPKETQKDKQHKERSFHYESRAENKQKTDDSSANTGEKVFGTLGDLFKKFKK